MLARLAAIWKWLLRLLNWFARRKPSLPTIATQIPANISDPVDINDAETNCSIIDRHETPADPNATTLHLQELIDTQPERPFMTTQLITAHFASVPNFCFAGAGGEFNSRCANEFFILPKLVVSKLPSINAQLNLEQPVIQIEKVALTVEGDNTRGIQTALNSWTQQIPSPLQLRNGSEFSIKILRKHVGELGSCLLSCEVTYRPSTSQDDGVATHSVKLSAQIIFIQEGDSRPHRQFGRFVKKQFNRLMKGIPEEIHVDPKELPVAVGRDSAPLRIRCPVVGPDGTSRLRPKLVLDIDQNSTDEALLKRVNDALNAELDEVRTDEPNTQVWEARLNVKLSASDESRLWPKFDSPAIPIRLKAIVTGYDAVAFLIHVNSRTEYPGWISIDFGTSHSTATLFDPHTVRSLDGLPREQYSRLCHFLLKHLTELKKYKQGGDSQQFLFDEATALCPNFYYSQTRREILDQWIFLLGQISQQIANGDSDDGLSPIVRVFESTDSRNQLEVHGVLRRIQLALGAAPPQLKDCAAVWQHRLFHYVFMAPPMEALRLFPVELSPLAETDLDRTEILSEAEVVSIDPLRVQLGIVARNNRLQFENQQTGEQKFFPALKRFLGHHEQVAVHLGGKKDLVSIEELAREAWRYMLDRTDEYRRKNPSQFSTGRIGRAIITYPTVSPPQYRVEIRELAQKLGLYDVKTDYDEAISAAIFYLMRDYDLGGSLSIGIESFKGRSTALQPTNPTIWRQNVLVLDIGGGTTDLALIQLTLKQEDILADEPGIGAHGYYYELTPKLLGSTGHMNIGGQLITMQVFRLLKFLVADRVLTTVDPMKLSDCPKHATFFENGRYIQGSLLNSLSLDSQQFEVAGDIAEFVLPTRWNELPHRQHRPKSPANRETFNRLWTIADTAKIALGKRIENQHHSVEPFEICHADVLDIIKNSTSTVAISGDDDLRITCLRTQFERVARPIIQDAIKLARGLLDARLPTGSDGHSLQSLDWLILSGKTCNLDLVEREVRSEFSESPYFTWNNDRVTFDPEFAKLSTSVGACYAEHLRQLAFDKEGARPNLRRGVDQLEFKIRNLFFFLPCSFTRLLQQVGEHPTAELFAAGTELWQLDDEPVGKARTKWGEHKASLQMTIHRQDYPGADQPEWGSLIAAPYIERLRISDADWRSLEVQFEVNHLLELSVHLCRTLPHYQIRKDVQVINLNQGEEPLFQASEDLPEAAAPLDRRLLLCCDVAINVNVPGSFTLGVESVLFKAGTPLDRLFHCDEPQAIPLKGAISFPLNSGFHRDGTASVYFRKPNGDFRYVDKIQRPSEGEFPNPVYISIDERGFLHVHRGEVPYWQAADEIEMWSRPGSVFEINLEAVPTDQDQRRDPFSGVH